MRRLLRAFALGLATTALVAGHADAHQGDPNYRSEVAGIKPPVDGLSAEILNYDSDIVLTSDGDNTIIVEGYEGEPYLRFSPGGAVEANLASPAYYLNSDRYGDAEVPADADPDADPDWKLVAGTGEFSWHDHRSHYMSTSIPPQVEDEGQRTRIFDYEIPLRVDGRPAAIRGTLYWVGSTGFPVAPFIALGLAAIGSAILALVVRRRRAGGRAGA
ncbi:MAG: hypothetical protein EDQ89_05960 [Acidobacteria bacterium]|nr:MAG: hypothetical protein EDQ89_05960 [Acidobacteriota bacterium]MCL4286653.1 hypothetical protein [Thermoleophilia bacterium]GIK76977.1 MAG: hypothetical protein BroJett022_06670 [Actinomycetes bacterium]